MSNVLNITYHDICAEVELLTLRANDLMRDIERKRREIFRSCGVSDKLVASYSGMPGSGYVSRPFDDLWEEKRRMEMELEEISDVLDLKKECKKRMEQSMKRFDSLEYRVAYLRDVERKPLYQIAKDLGYSYDWIREISARVKRVRQPTTNPQPA